MQLGGGLGLRGALALAGWFMVWLAAFGAPLHADTITLKNGSILNGAIVRETGDFISINTAGTLTKASRSRVASIEKSGGVSENAVIENMIAAGRYEDALVELGHMAVTDDIHKARTVETFRDRAIAAASDRFVSDHAFDYSRRRYDAILTEIERGRVKLMDDFPMLEVYASVESDMRVGEGNIHIDHMRWGEAEKCYRAALDANPGNSEASLAMGRLFIERGLWDEAVEPLEKAAEGNDDRETDMLLMQARFNSGRGGDALELHDRFLKEADWMPEEYRTFCEIEDGVLSEIANAYRLKSESEKIAGRTYEAERCQKLATEYAEYYKAAEEQRAGLAKRARYVASIKLKSPASSSGMNVLIFSTSWCGYCKVLKREYLTDSNVRQALSGFGLDKYDAERGEGERLAARYDVTGFPTTIITGKSGDEIDRISGLPGSPMAYAAWILSHAPNTFVEGM